ncbi:MAG: hypothetical protein QNJ87_12385 [Gammaproteobacteria bacterium]|nr:hypothetical protein [Gammaproteobacteria bacterium]MDJ0872553.1 hypothetical protein [Gammaproteobacteria bacterium]
MRLFIDNSLLRLNASPDGHDVLEVMAPSKEDIAVLFPDAVVESAADPEEPVYRYRANVPRKHVAGVLTRRIGAIR